MNSQAAIAETLSKIFDPELGIDIVALGLVYRIAADPEEIEVTMTTTTRSCPMSAAILGAVQETLGHDYPDRRVSVQVVEEPRWEVAMMDAAARAWLGMR